MLKEQTLNTQVTLDAKTLIEADKGLRFPLPQLGEFATGFAVRFKGKAYAYVNKCAHISVELDWNEGDFFTKEKDMLICSTHGAQYQPNTGLCVAGPCKGKSLQSLSLIENELQVIISLQNVEKS